MFDLDYVRYGFLQGDGNLGRLKSEHHLGLEINIGFNDQDVFKLFDISKKEGERKYYTNGYNQKLIELGFSSNQLPERILPTTFDGWSNTQKISFLRGLYSANGSVINVKNNCARITLKSTCKELVEQIKYTLELFGFHPYITTNKPKSVKFSNGEYTCKESYDLNIGRRNECIKFYDEIGFVHNYKMDKLKMCLGI